MNPKYPSTADVLRWEREWVLVRPTERSCPKLDYIVRKAIDWSQQEEDTVQAMTKDDIDTLIDEENSAVFCHGMVVVGPACPVCKRKMPVIEGMSLKEIRERFPPQRHICPFCCEDVSVDSRGRCLAHMWQPPSMTGAPPEPCAGRGHHAGTPDGGVVRPKRTPLSKKAQNARKPLPPEQLVDAKQDKVHTDIGELDRALHSMTYDELLELVRPEEGKRTDFGGMCRDRAIQLACRLGDHEEYLLRCARDKDQWMRLVDLGYLKREEITPLGRFMLDLKDHLRATGRCVYE